MLWRLAFLLFVGGAHACVAQFHVRSRYSHLASEQRAVPTTMLLNPMPSTNFETRPVASGIDYKIPWLGLAPASTSTQQPSNAPFWFGSMRTQRVGKFGTDHFFDLNGNLRNSSTFWDVRSKGNRGFKLYFSSR